MRIPGKPAPEPGEWETDEYGKRYRMIGNCKEYELELNGVPQSVFSARQKAQREQQERQIKEGQRKAAELARLRRNCPFRDGLQTDCSREACALFLDGCALARLNPAADTQGKQCPFNPYRQKCRKDCALYKGGCAFTGITANKESEDK